jgi:hypothetical protein
LGVNHSQDEERRVANVDFEARPRASSTSDTDDVMNVVVAGRPPSRSTFAIGVASGLSIPERPDRRVLLVAGSL